MPKGLDEFAKLEEVTSRAGGKKVEWEDVAQKIVATNEAYTVKEIWEKFCAKAVGLFRTKNALDALVEKGKLERRYDGKRFWYCKPTEA